MSRQAVTIDKRALSDRVAIAVAQTLAVRICNRRAALNAFHRALGRLP
jgi:hypothetical protein